MPKKMNDESFWYIYFVLVKNKLWRKPKNNAEIRKSTNTTPSQTTNMNTNQTNTNSSKSSTPTEMNNNSTETQSENERTLNTTNTTTTNTNTNENEQTQDQNNDLSTPAQTPSKRVWNLTKEENEQLESAKKEMSAVYELLTRSPPFKSTESKGWKKRKR